MLQAASPDILARIGGERLGPGLDGQAEVSLVLFGFRLGPKAVRDAEPKERGAVLRGQFYRLAIQSPYSSDETAQKLLRELLSSSLTRAGFEVVENDEPHYWWASSLALDNGSASAWTTVVHAVPEVRDESIGFTTTYREVAGKNVPFFGMHSLRVFNWSDAPATATRIAEEMAQGLLPAVHRRCYDMQLAAALKKAAKEAAEKAELERIRSELVEEMNRVRANRLRTSSRKEVRIEAEERPISPPAKRGAHD